MPLSLLEAAASGLMVIASDLPYVRELDIYKILCRDIQCFIENINKYIHEINVSFKEKVREKALKYCWDNILPKVEGMLIDVYETSTARRSENGLRLTHSHKDLP